MRRLIYIFNHKPTRSVKEPIISIEEVSDGLTVAAKQLQSRVELRAVNQQVAGVAALCYIQKVAPSLVSSEKVEQIIVQTLACQDEEGWFFEYGGADLGYLSVTIDCLWDAFDASNDSRFIDAAQKALVFLASFASIGGAGMHNARNTDYIVPYGIARFLETDYSHYAEHALFHLYSSVAHSDHFLHSIDDRYFCHYIGHSLYRALPLLRDRNFEPKLPLVNTSYPNAGYLLLQNKQILNSILISTKKGGCFTAVKDDSFVSDFGWIVSSSKGEWVSHWASQEWNCSGADNDERITIQGELTATTSHRSTPLKHVVLRMLSFMLGRKLISLLKEKMIFREKGRSKLSFSREISFAKSSIVVKDTIDTPHGATVTRAPRSSKRHVASADSFHSEDLLLRSNSISQSETVTTAKDQTVITTTYTWESL